MSGLRINLSGESSGALDAATEELGQIVSMMRARMASVEAAFRALNRSPDFLLKLLNISAKPGAACGDTADSITFTLEPSELMDRLLAALRAGDGQLHAIEIELGHLGVLSSEGALPGARSSNSQESRESPVSDKDAGEERGS